MSVVHLENIDINGTHGNIRAYNIDNKEEYIDFKMSIEAFGKINKMGINEDNIYVSGYDFFKDFHGINRYRKVIPIDNRFEIMDL